MTTHPGYAPPPISPYWLTEELLKQYPSHAQSKAWLEELAREYLKFWRLVLCYPDKRVVAPGPIVAVQRVHFQHREAYLGDCLSYFNRFLLREMIWRGRTDIVGAIDTVRAYKDLYHELPPSPWHDVTSIYNLRIPALRVVH